MKKHELIKKMQDIADELEAEKENTFGFISVIIDGDKGDEIATSLYASNKLIALSAISLIKNLPARVQLAACETIMSGLSE